MTILTPSPNPTKILNRSSTHNILTILSPAFSNSIYLATILQKLLSTTTIFLVFRAYLLSLILLQQSYYISSILLLQSYYLSQFTYWVSGIAAKGGYWGVKTGAGISWKALEPVRNKLFKEFMIFVLGAGNGVFLAVFWPGWLVVGPTVFGVWCLCV
ncbi:uncharacterized protein LY89DRAFT_78315 [Mollisia scopiformis]|uniref:Uncharacterized protein n=1 Tax=Mollisia scopiformis TaxID=149040 RepID=A0A194X812_MOLSC|nr:uncharacterized protein LY89DRAFT_78315 [Mollisia scopiformis]KUJ16254.1 hypothetical protein LY89DRAFT_78315 [Mollisia scopiformis]